MSLSDDERKSVDLEKHASEHLGSHRVSVFLSLYIYNLLSWDATGH